MTTFLKEDEAAAYLTLSRSTFVRLVEAHEIAVYYLGLRKARRFRQEDLDAYVQRKKREEANHAP